MNCPFCFKPCKKTDLIAQVSYDCINNDHIYTYAYISKFFENNSYEQTLNFEKVYVVHTPRKSLILIDNKICLAKTFNSDCEWFKFKTLAEVQNYLLLQ